MAKIIEKKESSNKILNIINKIRLIVTIVHLDITDSGLISSSEPFFFLHPNSIGSDLMAS
ncbi:MAG: hypothetical protein KAT49_06950 [Methanomicrobia archaeon]|nr:hypothetical protein [Methanomicrobia archaeon]